VTGCSSSASPEHSKDTTQRKVSRAAAAMVGERCDGEEKSRIWWRLD